MQQFSVVLQETRKWFQSFRLYGVLAPFELHLLFGALGIQFLHELLYAILPYSSHHALNVIFVTIPLLLIALYAFWIGAWMTLVSGNVKYLPYALWINAFVILFPFNNIGLGGLVGALVYVGLGYVLFRYTASAYANVNHSGRETHRF
ncbi:hypothetical protein J23TS9_32440 [Paenibacillus sp. J23TS9]|uniref:hypothetical protein n=1 Tax=Paenibacillus sp. J23TS9 TaxID=2807193 RepID=UPI001B0D6647|nr:hypothetical protein [Paenibacillus sp. J23TS9]GIP28114.1 hypothetical protein J23TS9_32440 [Paenibacillus sp. J23TS9]